MDKFDGRKNNKAPAEHQFQKGKSGNPRGRPKKRAREFSNRQILHDVLNMSAKVVKVDLGDGKADYTLQEAMILRMFTKAANGDIKMLKEAIPLLSQAYGTNEDRNKEIFHEIQVLLGIISVDPKASEDEWLKNKLDELRRRTKPQ